MSFSSKLLLTRRDLTRRDLLAAGGAAAATFALSGALKAAEAREYILATASTGGTFYPVGVGVATLSQLKLTPRTGIRLNAINSAGSGENVYLLQRNEAQFALMQSVFGYFASTGTGPFTKIGPQKNLRTISMMWQNVEHPVIRSSLVDTGTLSDIAALKGRPVSFGPPNTGANGSNTVMLNNFGFKDLAAEFKLVNLAYNATVDAIQNGQVDGAIIGGGVPVGAVTQLLAGMRDDITLLSITDDEIKAINGDRGIWSRYVIPAGTYPGQDEDYNTVGTPNLLTCRADVPDEDIYQIVKALYENLPFLNSVHGATKEMVLEKAVVGATLPIHPGAARYYQEQGVNVPANLIAD